MLHKLSVTSIILITGLGLAHYQWGLFEPYNWLTARKDIANQNIQLILYGEPAPNETLLYQAASELGFQYFRATGCTIDQPFINGAEDYNDLVAKYLNENSPGWKQKLHARKEQLKPKIIFDQTHAFDILSLHQLADYPSSDPDSSQCASWSLTKPEVSRILKELKSINGHEWHHLFGHYPCVFRGTLTQNNHQFEFAINAGSWLTISSDTTVYYGDLEGAFESLFLDTVWNEQEEKE